MNQSSSNVAMADTKKDQQFAEQYICPLCRAYLPIHEQGEHEDWHMAMTFQAQDQTDNSSAQFTNQTFPDPKPGSTKGTDILPSYAPPIQPPPAGSSRRSAMNHTVSFQKSTSRLLVVRS